MASGLLEILMASRNQKQIMEFLILIECSWMHVGLTLSVSITRPRPRPLPHVQPQQYTNKWEETLIDKT